LIAGRDLCLVKQLADHKPKGMTLSHCDHGRSVEQMIEVVAAASLPLRSAQVNLRQSFETLCDGATRLMT
jgi:hypothetical protein